MRKLVVVFLLSIVSMTLLSCAAEKEASTHEDNEEINVENIQYDSEIEEIRAKAKKELGIEIFIPDMQDLYIGSAFVSYLPKEGPPVQVDVQHYVKQGERTIDYGFDIVAEEQKEKKGVKDLVPPRRNEHDISFWFYFSVYGDFKKTLLASNLETEWIEINGNQVLLVIDETLYRYYVDDDHGFYMFGFNSEHYSRDEAEAMTRGFTEKIDSKQYE